MSELDIPIDIHTSKLLDWLVSRKHVKSDWSKKVAPIREKINEAINDMPNNAEMTALLSGSYINYFHCKEIVNILTTTEMESRTVFGTYSSKRMNDWLEIIKMYEKDNLFIAESARLYYGNVYYEIPNTKKQIHKMEQLHNDCEKREAELQKNHLALCSDFKTECHVLGIKGVNIREELKSIVPELTNICEEVATSVSTLKPVIDLYRQFKIEQTVSEVGLPLLLHVIEHGNTTVYEYLYKKAPENIVVGLLPYEMESSLEVADDDVIVFDDFVVESGTEEVIQDSKATASGTEALHVLDEPLHRDQFINDLTELQSFLKVRLSENGEGKSNANAAALNIEVAVVSEETVSKMLLQVNSIIELIDGNSARKLHNIKHLPRHLELLAVQLQNKEEAIEKNKSKIDACIAKGKQAYQDQLMLNDTLNIILDKTKQLKSQIECTISQLYNKRPVNLIGSM